jgi:sugar (pentulose or hexulose) kinase
LVTLKIGFDFLRKENVSIDSIVAHGGLFATERIGQKILAAALNTKVTVNKNASDGGPYGMALLAKYIFYNKIKLPIFLAKDPFKNVTGITLKASRQEINSFNNYATLFKKGLHIEREAIKQIKDYHK